MIPHPLAPSVMTALGFAALLSSAACDQLSTQVDTPSQPTVSNVQTVELPQDERAFLREIDMLPNESLAIVYEVHGEENLSGTLEVLAKPGGYRRENWTLKAPGANGKTIEVRGTTIQTPDFTWSGLDGESGDNGSSSPSHLGQLAIAFFDLEQDKKIQVIKNLRHWQRQTQQARKDHSGNTQTIHGVECLDITIATHKLCMWEEANLPLHYSGQGIELRATAIVPEASLAEDAFVIPNDSASTTSHLHKPSETTISAAGSPDPSATLEAIAEGKYAAMTELVAPRLQFQTTTLRR